MKKRLLALILSLILVLSTVIACSEPADEGSDITDGEGETKQSDETKKPNDNDKETEPVSEDDTLPPEEIPELPEDSFDGYEFVILAPEIVTYCYAKIDFDEPSDDPYENALYLRNLAVEEMYDITITEHESTLGPGVMGIMKTDVEAGLSSFGCVFNNMPYSCNAVSSDICLDMDELDFVNLDKVWWNDDATEQLALGNRHYMVAGDIAFSDKEGLWATYFMKDLIQENGLENPYELVANNEWTLDKMYEMASTAAFDSNGNSKRDEGDIWGLCTHSENYAATWQSAGLKLITLDDNGYPQISWNTDRFFEVYDRIAKIMGDADVVSPTDIPFISSALKEQQTLFGTEIIAFIKDYRTIEYEFGIVPYPKYDSSVSEYHSYIVTNSCVMTVGKTCDDLYRTGAIIEALAAKGHEILLPTYYEKQLKSRYARDEESAAMLDIIFENRSYDLGVFFNWGKVYMLLQSPDISPSYVYASTLNATNKAIEKSLSNLGLY